MILRQLGERNIDLVGVEIVPGVLIGAQLVPSQDIELNADFAPLSGDFQVPIAVQSAWSSASGGDTYLAPVYAGDAS